MSEIATPPGLIVVRHGHPTTDGQRLSRNGRNHANSAASLIETTLDEFDLAPEVVIAPDFHRHVATANIVAERLGVDVATDERLTTIANNLASVMDFKNPELAMRRIGMPEASREDVRANGKVVVGVMSQRSIKELHEAGFATKILDRHAERPDSDMFGYGRVFAIDASSVTAEPDQGFWQGVLGKFFWARPVM